MQQRAPFLGTQHPISSAQASPLVVVWVGVRIRVISASLLHLALH